MIKSSKRNSLLLILFLNGISCLPLFAKNAPGTGIYDGKIGNDRIILVAEASDSTILKGHFVVNRGKAVEESHAFSLNTSGNQVFFQSDLYLGKLKSAKLSKGSIEGALTLLNRKKRFFFWRQKVDFSLARRSEVQVTPTDRYQKEVFSTVEVKSDLVYGKAKGLWTRSPYSDDPYITTLSKGLVKSFNDPELMDLKLDIYYPKTDLFKNRPLVMLIHGGAFYIGSKESAAEKALATSLAKRGYVVASIDYRLGFKLSPADVELGAYRAVQDAHAALRFLAHNAVGLGINPNQIYVGGTSAGAVASLNVAFLDNDERPERILEADKDGYVTKIEASGNKYTESFEIKAVANMWGAVADLNIFDKDEKISVLSIHGTADGIVPYNYDHPFQNSLYVNRLLMDKMYGSKPIHERLQILGNRNRLVSLNGLGHEPELDNFKTLNKYMDTITYQVSRFFYEETAPVVVLPPSQLVVSENADLKSMYYEVNNGHAVKINPIGGVKVNADETDATIIWFENFQNRQLNIMTTNKFEAWNLKTYGVTVQKN
jgi:acetyl esterase/lipase